MTHDPTRFTHTVASDGPAKGMTFAGQHRLSPAALANRDVPLVVAIHGGGYTSDYFTVPQHSLLDRAAALDVPVIALDRPGYGGSDAVSTGDSVFLANAEVLDHLIAELWTEYGAGTAGVFLIGHSFGAVVAMAIAARRPGWPLLGIAVSGCLVRLPEGFAANWEQAPEWVPIPPGVKAGLMFGRDWTRRPEMPEAAAFASVPVSKAELLEIGTLWEPRLFGEITKDIAVPVHLRHGEYDALWLSSDDQVAEFVSALTASPRVDAELFTGAGHAIDFERGSAALQVQQLGFALDLAARLVRENA
ncbi:alpha/beta hydrolase [Herbiconiux sp. KACC 21604]|uniref:alpha/beta fold hydrolase n=1 Tax=unclassified Herbiconiux TaxID=2618217 RepID=UPI0014915BF7|nr:alpha/beta hydrolase [Herbiconiux sp. SALV-R1]QJU55296.1 alpha/beta hydrolase [Herbiconiux sp. SALV-R1]WPO86463.1 alpha/beta hydrolase [Herbiconiux sp. KACC 21604]